MNASKRKCDEQQFALPLELVDDDEWDAIEAAFDAVSNLTRASSIEHNTNLPMVSATKSTPVGHPLCRFNPLSADGHLACPISSFAQIAVPCKPLDNRRTIITSPERVTGVIAGRNGGTVRTGFQSRSLGGSARAQSVNQSPDSLSDDSFSEESPKDDANGINSALSGSRLLPGPKSVASGEEKAPITVAELDGAEQGSFGPCNGQLVRRLPSWMVGRQHNLLPQKLSTELGDLAPSVERSLNSPYALVQFELPFQGGLNHYLLKPKIPAMRFSGLIVYSKTESEVEAATRVLCERVRELQDTTLGAVPMGLDLEWKASFERGEAPRKAAVLQLCLDGRRCDVMQIIHSGIPSALQNLLEGSTTVKVGVGVHGDAARLRQDYQIATHKFLDLSVMANKKMNNSKKWSLSSLAQELTGKQVEKTPSIRCGDWEACPLSEPQLQYAATDAFASWHLYQVLASFRNPEVEITEDISNVQRQVSEPGSLVT